MKSKVIEICLSIIDLQKDLLNRPQDYTYEQMKTLDHLIKKLKKKIQKYLPAIIND
jgi:hypothetical protein